MKIVVVYVNVTPPITGGEDAITVSDSECTDNKRKGKRVKYV